MPFRTKLFSLAFFIPPGDVCFLILPVPRLNKHEVVFADPDAFLHATGDAGRSFRAVGTSDADAVCTEHLDNLCEHLIVVWHFEVASSLTVSVGHMAVIRAPTDKSPTLLCDRAVETAKGARSQRRDMSRIPAGAAELIELVAVAIGSGITSTIGVELERVAITGVASGDLVVGLWALAMGLVGLYVGIVRLGYEQGVPRLQSLLAGQ